MACGSVVTAITGIPFFETPGIYYDPDLSNTVYFRARRADNFTADELIANDELVAERAAAANLMRQQTEIDDTNSK